MNTTDPAPTSPRQPVSANGEAIRLKLLTALKELFALVEGEAPSLLRDDHHYGIVTDAIQSAEAYRSVTPEHETLATVTFNSTSGEMAYKSHSPASLPITPKCKYCNDTGKFAAWSANLGNHIDTCTCEATSLPVQQAQPPAIIRYTNYKGETSERRISPIRIYFGSTEWHPEEQWLLEALDLDRNAKRTFAMKDVLWAAPSTPPASSPSVLTAEDIERIGEKATKNGSAINRNPRR